MTGYSSIGFDMPRRREAALLAPVAEYVRRRGFVLQRPELPFYEYRIDLYGLSLKAKVTMAVELKLHRWRRALSQALIYQLCSDYVYIAMPSENLTAVDGSLLEGHGIGLISVTPIGRCATELMAKRSSEVRNYYRDAYITLLREERHAKRKNSATDPPNGKPLRARIYHKDRPAL